MATNSFSAWEGADTLVPFLMDQAVKYRMLRDLLIDLGCPWPEDGTELDKLTTWIRSMKKNSAYDRMRSYVLNTKALSTPATQYEKDLMEIMDKWGS